MGLMHIIWMLVVGLIVGALARFVMPGVHQAGMLVTALIGVAGSFIGGVISSVIWKPRGESMLHPAGFIMSVIGAMILIFILHHLHVAGM